MNLLKFFKTDDLRTKLAQKNILLLLVNKLLAAFISLQLIPATIGYVDAEQYGIWIAISSVAAWMLYFDFGLTHGFRNGFATAKAKGDVLLAKEYLSTTYAILILIFSILLVIGLIANNWFNWSSILSVNNHLDKVLSIVFAILIIFLSIQMVANIFTTFLLAVQKPALSAMIGTIGQFFALIAIYGLTFFNKVDLTYLAFALMGIPAILVVLISAFYFKTRFKEYAPSLYQINWKLTKSILGLGSRFFIIQLSMLFVFQFANFIIIKVMGATAVTNYSIAYRYYSIIYVLMGIIFLPFWSAFTEAYTKGEFEWMKKTYSKLSKIWLFTIVVFIGLYFISPLVYKYWLAKKLEVDYGLGLAMGISMIILSRANLYMFCLNGIGKVYLQMLVYAVFALISAPLMYYLTKLWGYYGVILVTSLVYSTQAIVGHIQLNKIINKNDKGIWSK